MDYDKGNIPAAYDAGRAYSPAMLALWLDRISRCAPRGTFSTILDLGCGTGRYSAALANHFKVQVIAIDRSAKMLAEARKKSAPRVSYARASGDILPLRGASIDMVFMSMVFHHFEDPLRAARECRRVLRVGGVICLRAATVDRIATYPYVPFFAGSRAILESTLQTQARIESIFHDAGFELARHELVRNEVASNWRGYAEKVGWGADSILAQLSVHEFREGMSLLSDHAATAGDEPVAEVVDLFAFRRPGRNDYDQLPPLADLSNARQK
jgi:ubiquinone/menaquinone biosynthesis C-methylase UbiE